MKNFTMIDVTFALIITVFVVIGIVSAVTSDPADKANRVCRDRGGVTSVDTNRNVVVCEDHHAYGI